MSAITVEEFVNKVGFSVDQGQLTRAQNQVNSAVISMGSGFSWILGKLAPLAAGYGIMQIGTYAVQSASQMERLTAQFGVMLQSATAGEKMVSDIQKLAASTPLTSMGVSESVKTLLAFGVAGKDAIETVRMLGDVAGGDQERLSRLALAYGQTMSAGKLMGQDLLQYINVGFNPLKVIGENLDKFGLKVGTTQSDLRDMMSKGQINASMVTQAFQMATSAGGMFYQNMEELSKTLGGLWSTMVDNVQLSLINALQPLIPMMKDMVNWAGSIDWTPMVNGMQSIASVVMFLAQHMDILKSGLVAVGAYMLIAWSEGLRTRIMGFVGAIQAQVKANTQLAISNGLIVDAENAKSEAYARSDAMYAKGQAIKEAGLAREAQLTAQNAMLHQNAETLKWEAYARSEALFLQSQSVKEAGLAREAQLMAIADSKRQYAAGIQLQNQKAASALFAQANALELQAIEARNVAIAKSTTMELESVAIRKEASLASKAMYAEEAMAATIAAQKTATATKIAALETTTASTESFATIKLAGESTFRAIGVSIWTALGPLGVMLATIATVYYGWRKVTEYFKESEGETMDALTTGAQNNFDKAQKRYDEAKGTASFYTDPIARKKMQAKEDQLKLNLDNAKKNLAATKSSVAESKIAAGITGDFSVDTKAWDDYLAKAKTESKQQTVNLTNTVNQHIIVEDYGDTKMSRAAVEDITKTAIRSAFQIQSISLSRVPA
jgi:tape measure domain-containing protein